MFSKKFSSPQWGTLIDSWLTSWVGPYKNQEQIKVQFFLTSRLDAEEWVADVWHLNVDLKEVSPFTQVIQRSTKIKYRIYKLVKREKERGRDRGKKDKGKDKGWGGQSRTNTYDYFPCHRVDYVRCWKEVTVSPLCLFGLSFFWTLHSETFLTPCPHTLTLKYTKKGRGNYY